jgi:hypothetical protein
MANWTPELEVAPRTAHPLALSEEIETIVTMLLAIDAGDC